MFPRILMIAMLLLGHSTIASAGLFDAIARVFSGSKQPAQPTIGILVADDQPGVLVEIQGKYRIYDPNTDSLLSARTLGKKRVMEAKAEGLKWGEEFPGIHQLKIRPEQGNNFIAIDGVQYPGAVYVFDIGGSISVVNEISIEEYLNDILSYQVSEDLPKETLAAIAIAARTQAYFDAQCPQSPFWSVDAKQVGYHGVVRGEEGAAIREAIRTTRSMILSRTGAYEGKLTPFPAEWKRDVANKTQAASRVFSRISLKDAEQLGFQGKDAATILQKAFPGSHIELIK